MCWSLRQVIFVSLTELFTNYWIKIKDKLEFEQIVYDKICSGISH